MKKWSTMFFESNICNISKDSLICKKPRHLTIIKNTSVIDDLYYIKHGLVYSVNKFFYLQKVSYGNYFSNKTLIPKAYFEIAQSLQLNIDKASYIQIVSIWMEKEAETIFYNKLSCKELPDSVPIDWGNIETEIIEQYKYIWNNNFEEEEYSSIYADFFKINNAGCLITGYGKTKACRMISEENLALDSVTLFSNNKQSWGVRGFFGGTKTPNKIKYCIHMLSPEETALFQHEIIETNLLQYIYYAEGNINYCGTTGAFYKIFEYSNTKYLLVPYYDSLEEKADALKQYLDNANENN